MREVISIDGPSASGKSTVARKVAAKIGWVYVDSGALYRAVAWKAIQTSVDVEDISAVEKMTRAVRMDFKLVDGAIKYTIDGVDPGDDIRTKSVTDIVSNVAVVPLVRERVVGWLRDMADVGKLVMEGRDIGTAVFPDAKWKFYLQASAEERARRRCVELEEKGIGEDLMAVTESIKRRDLIDSTRELDPLRIPDGAAMIDSTGMKADDVAELIVERVVRN